MMNLKQVQEALADRRLRVVAEATGLHYDTVWRVATGRVTEPSYSVIERLSDYLENREVIHG